MPNDELDTTADKSWRTYTRDEIDAAAKRLKRRYKVDATDYEAVWLLRDENEPGWRERKDKPRDRMVNCICGSTYYGH